MNAPLQPQPRTTSKAAEAPGRAGALQRKCACGGAPGPTGECTACRRKRLHGAKPLPLQPKLTINQPNDRYEQEADRVADEVMRMAAPLRQHPGPHTGANEERLQTKPAVRPLNSGSSEGVAAPPIVHTVLRGQGAAAGHPLDAATRGFMEARFGHDFSRVRVHTDDKAAASAQAVSARAYTVGAHVVFGAGQYTPTGYAGRRLLAHELTHVVQQTGVQPHVLQRTDWGPLGGKCCNESPEGDEWGLVGDGTWVRLSQGECTGFWTDCDGMTCGGGFYKVGGLEGGICRTPRHDDATYRPRRWTPTNPNLSPAAVSPTQRGSQEGDVPPDYAYDEM